MPDIVVLPQTIKAMHIALKATSHSSAESNQRVLHHARWVLDEVRAAVAARTAEVDRWERALESCRASDRQDCSYEAQQLVAARRRLQNSRHCLQLVMHAMADYEAQAAGTLRRVNQIHELGQRFLSRKLAKVAAVNGGISSASAATAAIGASQQAASAGPTGAYKVPGMRPGWMMVPISQIDQTSDPIQGPQDFQKGYSIEDLDYAFELLENSVLPALANGAGPDQFATADQANKDGGTRSVSMTYGHFLREKGDAIRLELRRDGKYHIDNGRHRIWVAAATGRTHVPAYILGGQP